MEQFRKVNFPTHDRACDDRIGHLNHLLSLIVPSTKVSKALADHFNVARLTISRLLIRLRQTGRKNDRPRDGRPRVTS